MKITLEKPFEYQGDIFYEIDLDFDNASGKVLRQADLQMSKMKHFAPIKADDTTYCLLVASKLSKIPFETLDAMPLKVVNRLRLEVGSFLLNTASEDLESGLS